MKFRLHYEVDGREYEAIVWAANSTAAESRIKRMNSKAVIYSSDDYIESITEVSKAKPATKSKGKKKDEAPKSQNTK